MYHEALSEALPGDNVGFNVKNVSARGAWVAQSVKRLTLGSGHDLAVSEFESRVGVCADSSEPGACFRFCVSLSLCPSPARALSLSKMSITAKWLATAKMIHSAKMIHQWKQRGFMAQVIIRNHPGSPVCIGTRCTLLVPLPS